MIGLSMVPHHASLLLMMGLIIRKREARTMTVTIYDVAREANVSMATVSRVVNGNQNVKPATRKKY